MWYLLNVYLRILELRDGIWKESHMALVTACWEDPSLAAAKDDAGM